MLVALIRGEGLSENPLLNSHVKKHRLSRGA